MVVGFGGEMEGGMGVWFDRVLPVSMAGWILSRGVGSAVLCRRWL